MKYLNKNYPNTILNKNLRAFYKQKQKINNSGKYTKEEKELIMKGIDMCINALWQVDARNISSSTNMNDNYENIRNINTNIKKMKQGVQDVCNLFTSQSFPTEK